MKAENKYSHDERMTIIKTRVLIKEIAANLNSLNEIWDTCNDEILNHLYFQYPFSEGLDKLVINAQIWAEDADKKATALLNEKVQIS